MLPNLPLILVSTICLEVGACLVFDRWVLAVALVRQSQHCVRDIDATVSSFKIHTRVLMLLGVIYGCCGTASTCSLCSE